MCISSIYNRLRLLDAKGDFCEGFLRQLILQTHLLVGGFFIDSVIVQFLRIRQDNSFGASRIFVLRDTGPFRAFYVSIYVLKALQAPSKIVLPPM